MFQDASSALRAAPRTGKPGQGIRRRSRCAGTAPPPKNPFTVRPPAPRTGAGFRTRLLDTHARRAPARDRRRPAARCPRSRERSAPGRRSRKRTMSGCGPRWRTRWTAPGGAAGRGRAPACYGRAAWRAGSSGVGSPGAAAWRTRRRCTGFWYDWTYKVQGKSVAMRLTEARGQRCEEWLRNRGRLRKIVHRAEALSLRETDRLLRATAEGHQEERPVAHATAKWSDQALRPAECSLWRPIVFAPASSLSRRGGSRVVATDDVDHRGAVPDAHVLSRRSSLGRPGLRGLQS